MWNVSNSLSTTKFTSTNNNPAVKTSQPYKYFSPISTRPNSGPNNNLLPVIVQGGSHGGFLTAQIIGRNRIPGIVGGLMRNPVVDLEGFLRMTDIPEWVIG